MSLAPLLPMLLAIPTISGCSPAKTPASPAASAAHVPGPEAGSSFPFSIPSEHTVESRLAQFGEAARARWAPSFATAGVEYPGREILIVAYKREGQVEVYAGPSRDALALIRHDPTTARSGGPGPKLREGDRQIPEGIYDVVSLNPNSRFHLSLRLGYPNAFERAVAERDGRRNLGGDIMIHGGSSSIGCIAVGDLAAEDLFVLAADAGIDAVRVVIVPHDLRGGTAAAPPAESPSWVGDLYAELREELLRLPQSIVADAAPPARDPS